jgi:hypothetical protein
MLEGVARAIALSIERGWSAPDTTILGHRDNPAHPGSTGCPGDWLYEQLPAIRTRVAQLLAPPQPPEEPDMIRAAVIRFAGFDDQVKVETIANPEHHAKLGITGPPIVVSITAAQRAAIEAALGFPLTPS